MIEVMSIEAASESRGKPRRVYGSGISSNRRKMEYLTASALTAAFSPALRAINIQLTSPSAKYRFTSPYYSAAGDAQQPIQSAL